MIDQQDAFGLYPCFPIVGLGKNGTHKPALGHSGPHACLFPKTPVLSHDASLLHFFCTSPVLLLRKMVWTLLIDPDPK